MCCAKKHGKDLKKYLLIRNRTELTSKVMSTGGKYFRLGAQGSQSMEDFSINGRSDGGLRWLKFNGGGPIRRAESKGGLTSPPP